MGKNELVEIYYLKWGGRPVEKGKTTTRPKSDIANREIFKISELLNKIDMKLFIVVILLIGILIVAIADL
jgi:hypothetical protein